MTSGAMFQGLAAAAAVIGRGSEDRNSNSGCWAFRLLSAVASRRVAFCLSKPEVRGKATATGNPTSKYAVSRIGHHQEGSV